MSLRWRIRTARSCRWASLCLIILSLWPGILYCIADDRDIEYEGNDLVAFGLIFSVTPLALLIVAWARRRETPIFSSALTLACAAALYLTCYPAWFDAYHLGLGAYSKVGDDDLDWFSLVWWTVMALIGCAFLVAGDWLTSLVVRFFRGRLKSDVKDQVFLS